MKQPAAQSPHNAEDGANPFQKTNKQMTFTNTITEEHFIRVFTAFSEAAHANSGGVLICPKKGNYLLGSPVSGCQKQGCETSNTENSSATIQNGVAQ
jgi:hypothetical protein